MKNFLIIPLLLTLFFLNSCDYRKKNTELSEREKKLAEREKEFSKKENEYNSLIRLRDSLHSKKDSTATVVLPQNIIGKWSGKIICSESTCPENMIGDIRTDTWEFSENSSVISAKVTDKTGNIRVYTGTYNGSEMHLTNKNDSAAVKKPEITIILNDIQDGKIKGSREMTSENNCVSRFSVDLEKAKN